MMMVVVVVVVVYDMATFVIVYDAVCFRVLETPSASQQVNRKDMRQDASGSNKSYDIHIENFDVSYGDKYVYVSVIAIRNFKYLMVSNCL